MRSYIIRDPPPPPPVVVAAAAAVPLLSAVVDPFDDVGIECECK
jgi:hypothetical protein